jgi:hypothetical protein
MSWPVLLRAIVIDADNKAIRFKEGASTSTLSLAEGTYYLRGDGAADDLLKAVKDAFDAAGATNTYTVAIAWSIDPDAAHAVVTITQSGGATFQILWADALTTFNEAWLGFTNANTADSTAAKTSTLSPSAAWVSAQPLEMDQPIDRAQTYVQRARSRRVRRGKYGTTAKDRRIDLALIPSTKTHEQFVSAGGDVARAFNRFLDELREGAPLELHLASVSSGFVLAALSSSTESGAGYVLGEDADADFEARRLNAASGLWSWSLELMEHVA